MCEAVVSQPLIIQVDSVQLIADSAEMSDFKIEGNGGRTAMGFIVFGTYKGVRAAGMGITLQGSIESLLDSLSIPFRREAIQREEEEK